MTQERNSGKKSGKHLLSWRARLKHHTSGKASGLGKISTALIKHFRDKILGWLLVLFNKCTHGTHILKFWRHTKIVALLKQKATDLYHLYILFKLHERLIMAHIKPTVEKHLTPAQCGFGEGQSCCGQVIKVIQHIEDNFKAGMVTAAFVNLTATYNTVIHWANS